MADDVIDAVSIRADLARELLVELTEDLCAFSLCDGPDTAPVPMKTCRVCATIHELRGIVAHAESPVCECEHARHFDTRPGRDADAHPHRDRVTGVRPADVPFPNGVGLCPWCLTHCHPTTEVAGG